jgi:hypothetical protein
MAALLQRGVVVCDQVGVTIRTVDRSASCNRPPLARQANPGVRAGRPTQEQGNQIIGKRVRQISEGDRYARDLPQGPIGPMKALLETAALSWIKPKV